MSIYEAITDYLDAWDDIRKAYYERRGYKWPTDGHLALQDNPKWLKIINIRPDLAGISQTSVEAFIDRETVDIYKPASWSRPAKHIRGNVFSDKHGMESIDDTAYPSVRYLR